MSATATLIAIDIGMAFFERGMKFTTMVQEARAQGREVDMGDLKRLKAETAILRDAWDNAGPGNDEEENP